MSNIRMDFSPVGRIGTNCYLLVNESEKKGVVIDPGDDADRISAMIERNDCSLEAVLLTHGHYDHIMAADQIRNKYQVKIYAALKEDEVLKNPQINLSKMAGMPVSLVADVWVNDGECLELAGMNIQVIRTPGHTEGGTCYYLKEQKMLFSGDTLFAESVGRTDFPTGSMSEIVRSVKEKLLVLPEDTIVFPGHGESTSIGHEKEYNPYCQ